MVKVSNDSQLIKDAINALVKVDIMFDAKQDRYPDNKPNYFIVNIQAAISDAVNALSGNKEWNESQNKKRGM